MSIGYVSHIVSMWLLCLYPFHPNSPLWCSFNLTSFELHPSCRRCCWCSTLFSGLTMQCMEFWLNATFCFSLSSGFFNSWCQPSYTTICKYRRTSSNYYSPHPPLFSGTMFQINYLHSNPYFRDGFWRTWTKSHLYIHLCTYAHINIKLPWLGERNTMYVSGTEEVLSQSLHNRNYWEEGTRKQNRFHLQEKY